MWWIFGLINVVIVFVVAWFYCSEIKEEEEELSREDAITIGTLAVLAFLGGILVFVLLVGLFAYLIIDFIKFLKNKR